MGVECGKDVMSYLASSSSHINYILHTVSITNHGRVVQDNLGLV